mmetsp:Transcript_21618/g.51302  ORF Transcript_21618/g.51302 Transcript_21618/m.51302 type:complete len:234 (+) Transcript_21618:477-1178(+)
MKSGAMSELCHEPVEESEPECSDESNAEPKMLSFFEAPRLFPLPACSSSLSRLCVAWLCVLCFAAAALLSSLLSCLFVACFAGGSFSSPSFLAVFVTSAPVFSVATCCISVVLISTFRISWTLSSIAEDRGSSASTFPCTSNSSLAANQRLFSAPAATAGSLSNVDGGGTVVAGTAGRLLCEPPRRCMPFESKALCPRIASLRWLIWLWYGSAAASVPAVSIAIHAAAAVMLC